MAPRFETAESIVICTVVESHVIDSETQPCSGCEGFSRVRLLREHQVDTVICNGIRSLYRNVLRSLDVVVIDGVSMTIDAALDEFVVGGLRSLAIGDADQGMECEQPHEDLICWAGGLLASCGWQVRAAGSGAPFAVDLTGSIECPVCRRPIRVAVCCGAHIYRCDREIREFHYATMNDFHARLYVHPANQRLLECCRSFGIQLVDPGSYLVRAGGARSDQAPPLAVAVVGHDRLQPFEPEADNEHPHSNDKRERG